MAVGEIVIDVTADVGPLIRQMKKAEGALGGLQGAAGSMGDGLSRAGGMAVTFGTRMAIVTAGVAAVTAATTLFVKGAASIGEAIEDASKAAGMSTTAFQEYRFALKEAAAMSDEEFASAAERLNKTLGEARQGSAAAVKAFEAIGVSQSQLADSSLTTDQAMAAFVANMEATKDPAIAAAVATALFGKAGAGLGAALSGTPGQVAGLIERAKELGVVLGPDATRAAGEFGERMSQLGDRFDVLKLKLADKLLPVLVDDIIPAIEKHVIPAIEWLGEKIFWAAGEIAKFAMLAAEKFADFRTSVGGAVDWVIGKFTAFMAKLDQVLQKVQSIGNAIATTIGSGLSVGQGEMNSGSGYGGMAGAGDEFGTGAFGGGSAGGAMGGQMLGAGIVNGAFMGAMNAINEKREAFAALFAQIPQIARETLGINSPSTVFAEIGGFLGQGFANGIEASNGIVATAVSAMGTGAVGATDDMVNDVLGGLNILLAGSQKAGAALALVNTMIGASNEITKGTFGFTSAAKVIAQGMGFVKAIKGAKGGGGSSAGGGGGAAAAAAPQQAVQDLGITFVNDPFGIGERTARAIAIRFNEAQRNGVRLNVSVGA